MNAPDQGHKEPQTCVPHRLNGETDSPNKASYYISVLFCDMYLFVYRNCEPISFHGLAAVDAYDVIIRNFAVVFLSMKRKFFKRKKKKS